MARLAPVLAGAAALLAALVRWIAQGSGNLYTARAKRFYVPDPDVGWRVSSQHPLWIGLELCAVMLAVVVGIALLTRRRSAGAMLASWFAVIALAAIPIVAFISGPGPRHGVESLPAATAVRFESGIEASLAAPSGHYVVVPHAGTAITAKVRAGGEAFEARFAHDVSGTWDAVPGALDQPQRVTLSVATTAVDTGVGERTDHAREKYLRAAEFPQIGVALDRVIATRALPDGEVAFRAAGSVELLGKTHPVEVTGTVRVADAAAQTRLGVTGDVVIVQADFALALHDTALATKLDGNFLPVHASLVMRRDR